MVSKSRSSTTAFQLRRALAGLALGAALASGASAAETSSPEAVFGISFGTSWSDNIALVPVNEETGGVAQLGLNIARLDERVRLRSDMDVNLGYQTYLSDEFGDQLVGGAALAAELSIVPNVLEWYLQENLAQVRDGLLGPDTPDNVSTLNYLTTGPRLMLALTPTTGLGIEGLYTVDSVGSSFAVDSQRAGGSATLSHAFNRISGASLSGHAERRWFNDDIANQAYTTRGASLAYALTGSRTVVSTSVGIEQFRATLHESSGLSATLSLERRLSPSNSLRLEFSRDLSDAGETLRVGQDFFGVGQQTELVVAVSDAFVRRAGTLAWDFERNRTAVGAQIGYSKESYERLPEYDRKVMRYRLSLARLIGPRMRLNAEVGGFIEDYQIGGARVNEVNSLVSMTWDATRTLATVLQYDYRSRGGEGPVGRFTENRGSVFLVWSPRGQR